MASISKLQIQGMRSFGPDNTDRQNVAFFSPLTLILGQNGCGKTTIIECLKYVTTGDVPPGAGRGASFIHDPKMARETCVKGQVKLAFSGVGNTCKIISRSIEASQKLKTIQVKTLDSTITDKTNPANHIQISSKCADINSEIFNCLGVSKPILNYVIFCHQEDSNWPLDEGSKVKDKFDEIFNSAKYKKCLNNIKVVRKAELDKAKIEKNDVEHYKSDKQYADQKKKELLRKEEELARIEEFIDEVTTKLGPLRDKYKDVQQEEEGFSSIQKKLAEAETSLRHCRNERESLENTIKEVIDDTESDEDIKAKMDGLQLESKKKEKLVNDLKENLIEIKSKMDKGEKTVQKNAAQIGKAIGEGDQHKRNVSEMDALRETAEQDLDIVDDGNDVMFILKKEDAKIKNRVKQMKAEHKKIDDKIEEEIDQIKGLKTGLEAGKKREQAELISNKKEIAQLKRQLNDLEGAAEKLERIKEEWKEGNDKIETEKRKHDKEALQEEIDQEKETVKNLDVSAVKLRGESRTLEEKQSSLQRITHISEEVEVKETKMKRTLNKRNSDLLQLFGEVPDPKRLKNAFRDGQEKAENSLKEMDFKRKKVETEINSRRILKKDLAKDIDKKSARLQQLESKVGDHLGPDEDIESEIVRTQENLASSRKELQVKEAGKFTYREMIERMRGMSQPACPTCNRGFNKPNEPDDLIEELTELINEIPNKVKSLDNKVKKLTTRLETLQRIRPEVHSLKQIRQELQEGKSKIEELDKEIKSFQSDLEDQEEDWNITEVNVTLFKQVSEDVQAVDNLYKELLALKQKKSDLTLECGTESGSGTRSLETVREEEEQVALKLRSARRNLEQCQETLNKHTTTLNNLEASQNRLTNRKLEIEGQQQQIAATVNKKEELEEKTRKCMEEVQRCDRELEPLHEQLEIAEQKKVSQRRKAEDEINCMTEKERKVDKLIGEAVRLESAIKHYNESGKEEEFNKLKKEKLENEEIMRELKDDRSNVETNLKNIEQELSNQDGHRRHYEDNLRFREYKAQEKKHRKTVENQQDILEQMDYGKVEQKKNEVLKQINKLSSERSEKEGQITELKRSVKELQRELDSPKLRDAARKFKEKSIKHSLRTKVGEDLNKYYIALNWAIMNFHKEKMKNINKVIRELWRSTYRGNDIDYIEIKTDDGEVTSGAEKRTTYNYRVVMVKNDTEMDMRGRCSAGQKVLSSLIIRLALAETFSTNCGIIALDEPTTNLDRENIESLALALSEIVTRRAQQRNFQLVVITHDEEFIELLSRCGQLQHYQKVSRNSRGLSEVRKYDISSLEEAS